MEASDEFRNNGIVVHGGHSTRLAFAGITAMYATLVGLLLMAMMSAESMGPGNHNRSLHVDGLDRGYLVHVPPKYDPKTLTPVVLVLHGAWTNGPITALYSGFNRTADENNFIAVYPNGTGIRETALFWNSGGHDRAVLGGKPTDDVKFIGAVLDDLGTAINFDPKRVFATGISNGGMMCYRLAAEMSDRIAAIAPISGTLCLDDCHPTRPVPVLHFHGTEDKLVLYDGSRSAARFAALQVGRRHDAHLGEARRLPGEGDD